MKLHFGAFLLLALVNTLSSSAQVSTLGANSESSENVKNMINIIPPSPDAFSFSRYGNLPIGLFTGSAEFSLPVYTIKSGSLSHNISLNYHTNGIKVDEIATRVGIGWVLSAGGTISRTVLDLPDEFSDRAFYHNIESDTSAVFYDFVKRTTYSTSPDYQPDEYSFNVNGLSGKFIKAEDSSFKIIGASKVKIQAAGGGFLLTATDGVKYYFDLFEMTKNVNPIEPEAPQNIPNYTATAWYLTKIKSPTNDSIIFNYSSLVADTVTYVNGISQELSTNSTRTSFLVVFQYNENSSPAVFDQQHLECLDNECSYFRTNIEITKTAGKYLSSIVFNNGRVDFVVSGRLDIENEIKIDSIKVQRLSDNTIIKSVALVHSYAESDTTLYDTYGASSTNITNAYYGLRKRLYLNGVKELSNDNSASHDYTFTYDSPNALPPRLSFSQDKFGYFNGKVNTYFVPNDTWWDWWIGDQHFGGDRNYDFSYAKKGVLTKIKYPTGGTTTIEYEPNKIDGYVKYLMNIQVITNQAIDTSIYYQQVAYSDTFHAVAGKEIIVKAKCNWASSVPEFFPESYWSEYKIVNASDSSDACCNIRVNPGDSISFVGSGLTSGNVYRLKIMATQARLKINTTISRIWKTVDTSVNVGIGGIRVKALVDSADEARMGNRREFYYRNWESDVCSGKGLYYYADGRNFVSLVRRLASKTGYGVLTTTKFYAGNNILRSNSIRNTYLNDMGGVTYTKVIELNVSSNGQNGGIEYTFRNERKSSAKAFRDYYQPYIFFFSAHQIDGTPFSNDDFGNGSPLNTKYFSYSTKFGTRTVLKETQNYYSSSDIGLDSVYVVKNIYPLPQGGINLNDYPCNNYCSRFFYYFDINKYYRHYNWFKLDSTIQKDYQGSNTLQNKTTYTYTSVNYKVSSEVHSTSTADNRSVYYHYPGNITSSSEAGYSNYYGMTLANILDIPIRVITEKNSNTKQQQTFFNQFTVGGNTFYQPSDIKSAQNTVSPQTELTIEQYNSQGNIVQYKAKDGVTNTIIWGYGGVYPVAKVSGATYSACMAVLNSSVLNNPSSDNALRTELNKLRTQLSGTVFVTTITYAPLIGVTSETNVNNRTVYYEYDKFNRLQIIRDQDNNIIKRICYNYKGEQTECAETHTFPATPCNANNCNGLNKMCINGVCVTSTTLVLISSVQIGPHNWNCTYAYSFAGGTILGQEFTETGAMACLEF